MDKHIFDADLIWVTKFMIQKALEDFIENNKTHTYHQFVLRNSINGIPQHIEKEIVTNFTDFGENQDPLVAELPYDSKISIEDLLTTFEDAWIVDEVYSKYPKFVFPMLANLYLTLSDSIVCEILKNYSIKIHGNSTSLSHSDITIEKEQRDILFSIARSILYDKEHRLFLEELNAYVSPYEYSVIDIYNMKEYECALGDHGITLVKLIQRNFQEEFKKIHLSNNIEAENHWILTHFKFNGKFGGNTKPFRTPSERDLYTKMSLRANKNHSN